MSSYLEGEKNDFGAYGYSRDFERGKKQIVIGLLCDEESEPVSTEVFNGNTQDPATFASQVRRAGELAAAGFHYITAITKPQIETLIAGGIVQMELFDQKVCEVEHEGGSIFCGATRCRPTNGL